LPNAPAVTSEGGKWEAAVVTGASAKADNTGFTIIVNVELPQPKACYDVQLARPPILIPPYHYLVQQRHNGKICTYVITQYIAKQHFGAKPLPKSVNLYALDVHHNSKQWVLPIILEHK
jgi:hypothetical protein